MFFSVWLVRLRDAASTASHIMSMACSVVVGFGPGYVKKSSRVLSFGCCWR